MGFVAPMIVGFIINGQNDVASWQSVFWISTGVYAVGSFVFILFGSSEEQSWNSGNIYVSKWNSSITPEILNKMIWTRKRTSIIIPLCKKCKIYLDSCIFVSTVTSERLRLRLRSTTVTKTCRMQASEDHLLSKCTAQLQAFPSRCDDFAVTLWRWSQGITVSIYAWTWTWTWTWAWTFLKAIKTQRKARNAHCMGL